MKANYDDTHHSRVKNELYLEISEINLTAIAFFLMDKMGYSPKKTAYALEYLLGTIQGVGGSEIEFREMKRTLKEDYGIQITRKSGNLSIFLDEENG